MNLDNFFQTQKIKGFLAHDEGMLLHGYAKKVAQLGPCLEVGSYCGKSSVYIASACKQNGSILFALDHHQGSEEHQPGEGYHDSELFDAGSERMNSFPAFLHTLRLAGVENCVVPLVCASQTLAPHWHQVLGMVFIDGGHSEAQAFYDCQNWSRHVAEGGYLAIHDIYETPEEGGQAPRLAMQSVVEQGCWQKVAQVKSLVILQKNTELP